MPTAQTARGRRPQITSWPGAAAAFSCVERTPRVPSLPQRITLGLCAAAAVWSQWPARTNATQGLSGERVHAQNGTSAQHGEESSLLLIKPPKMRRAHSRTLRQPFSVQLHWIPSSNKAADKDASDKEQSGGGAGLSQRRDKHGEDSAPRRRRVQPNKRATPTNRASAHAEHRHTLHTARGGCSCVGLKLVFRPQGAAQSWQDCLMGIG